MIRIISPILAILLLSTISCGNTSNKEQRITVTEIESISVQAMQDHPGKRVYDQYCKACHMTDGSGVKGMHPPLVNNKTVTGNNDKLIEVTMKGMSGKVVIDGVTYNGIMPPHNHLTNQQIVDVLNYVRQSFTKSTTEITTEEVQKLR